MGSRQCPGVSGGGVGLAARPGHCRLWVRGGGSVGYSHLRYYATSSPDIHHQASQQFPAVSYGGPVPGTASTALAHPGTVFDGLPKTAGRFFVSAP